MKFHAVAIFASPLLALAITATASHTVFAQDDAVTEPEQLEREQLERPDDANADQQDVPQSDTDCVDLPDTASQNAQGAISQAGPNAQESTTDENTRAGAATNPDAQIAQNRDDCLDLRSRTPATQD